MDGGSALPGDRPHRGGLRRERPRLAQPRLGARQPAQQQPRGARSSRRARRAASPIRTRASSWTATTSGCSRPVTAWSGVARSPERIPQLVRWALREALTGRPGPTHLEIPIDVLRAEAAFDPAELDAPLERFLPTGRAPADPAAVEDAAGLLSRARRPLIIAGGGAALAGAERELRALGGDAGRGGDGHPDGARHDLHGRSSLLRPRRRDRRRGRRPRHAVRPTSCSPSAAASPRGCGRASARPSPAGRARS